MATIHDSGYKLLFSNLTIFRQLIESFVDLPWVKQLDFDRAVKIDKSFIDEEYRERESDLIYRIPFGEDEMYVYVLLEFQSSVDRWMALRVLEYVIRLYLDLSRSQELKKLPPVFPIVLYNGDRRWTAATDMSELVDPLPTLGEYSLDFRYFLLAENELSRESLVKIGNIVSTLFLAEGRYDLEQMLEELIALFEKEEDKRAVSLLINWFRQMTLHKRVRPEEFERLQEAYRSSEEVHTMFVTMLEEYEQKIYERGKEEGREESQAKVIVAMVQRGFDFALIADLLAISQDEATEIYAKWRTQPNQDKTEPNGSTA